MKRQRQTAIRLPITPLGWNGSSACEDRRQYLSYSSEIALQLPRHLLQFVLISCSCAVAISSKRSAVAHTDSEEHLHACIAPHLQWESPTTSKPAQHYCLLWNSGTTTRWLNGHSVPNTYLLRWQAVRADFPQYYCSSGGRRRLDSCPEIRLYL